MKAMVLAAGFGSRLKDFTKETPKCLVPLIDGSTMLSIVLNRLKQAGVHEAVINLHYLGASIKQYLADHDDFGMSISYSEESKILGTGGGLRKAGSFFKSTSQTPSPFFLHNSDVWCNVDLKALYDEHVRSGALVTLAVTKRETKRPLFFLDSMNLTDSAANASDSANQGAPFGFSGIQVVSPAFLPYLDRFPEHCSTIPAFHLAAQEGEVIRGFDITESSWIDMGTPESLERLNKLLDNEENVQPDTALKC